MPAKVTLNPLPAFKGKNVIAIGSADVAIEPPAAIQVATAGNLTYVTLRGDELTENTLAAGDDIVGPGGGLVLVREIKGTSTVTSVVAGYF